MKSRAFLQRCLQVLTRCFDRLPWHLGVDGSARGSVLIAPSRAINAAQGLHHRYSPNLPVTLLIPGMLHCSVRCVWPRKIRAAWSCPAPNNPVSVYSARQSVTAGPARTEAPRLIKAESPRTLARQRDARQVRNSLPQLGKSETMPLRD